MLWLIFALSGLLAGVLGGLLGIGGATIIIPSLVLLANFDQKLAQGTTVFLMVFPIGLLAAIEYYRAGYVRVKEGIIIAIFFFIGGLIGSKLSLKLDSSLLRKLFSIFLIFIAIRMFFSK